MKTMLSKCVVGLIALLLILSSCDPVKKVLRSPDKTLQVVEFYLTKYPIMNDTSWIKLPGDTLIESTVDTVLDLQRDTLLLDTTYYITKTVTKYRVDTLVRTIVDRKLQTELQKQNVRLGILLDEQKEKTATEQKDKRKWKLWFIIICVIVGCYIGINVYKSFKPSINVSK